MNRSRVVVFARIAGCRRRRCTSELTRDEKSALSHRGHAVRAMLPQLIAAGA
ncbi:MAG: hypothetical protein Q8N23_07520 [Archangium sp.]|nr:hypothetical protein [Archangium sp.]MDP3152504.1 hypothetical protein [Archangium sp.]MDP3572326.1 hypothetical protein [Archangium sp.]